MSCIGNGIAGEIDRTTKGSQKNKYIQNYKQLSSAHENSPTLVSADDNSLGVKVNQRSLTL